ncbi:SDR family oxidoreductase [Sulfitobacter pseudonitzschiae]|jgi:2-keto-3-deoxy-L-fuconate dehydrogenase|uniref:SDR family oxidoreductase n=1 Tax=Pseudosulfitobacter pseudonitzschiae TaxID=1402135 RepID=A0A9Q2RU40_9RHOB|nr:MULTISPECIES: SDR family oxidoreductase [Roseobacteraceae]MBM2291577.1 SDR family oxidoreductase [Pseudosulfitobacter pseudonitzschiae]MBM2296495.1 SDR family oxidoreductase [Pseudosulfitobacter pseudonitzschiae]MBM2301408.1 SDR family oxidoreductase [Pseudosulfitobacter pseudonitzschiae]MBM2311192.1 SDR family oxidoreductase [Pseudosulfitobacter pseudonitzschiae]MBM2316105.1 SDR family oxidoreductase [Pseudosulfitobacter pseudonitzschiae]|tara:strand:- start:3672 stop:4415 length:744 start_codon:yes stop_codon:yes gene_type:complete
MGRLDGKRALITAAGQGIGRASALAMAAEGAQVFATDISAEALAELKGDGIETMVLDARDTDSVNAGVAKSRPDVLFNCAGFVHHGTVLDASDDEWDFAFDLNVRAMFRTIRAALPGMVERGAGSIVNMSSACSSIIGAPNRFIYGTTKAAVIGLTKSVAVDYIKTGVRCNCICPGTVESPSWHDRVKALGEEMGSYEAALEAFVSRQPMGRVAKAEEIAALVVYLASDESGFTTGQPHVIDGGWSG